MKGNVKKTLAVALTGACVASMAMTGCGKKSAGSDTEFTWMLDQGVENYLYEEYENGVCQNGITGENARSYIECMSTWYEKGWIDQKFEERSSDIFFNVDSAATYAGKVGLWLGYTNQIGNSLDTGDGFTKGICVFGAPQPINDKYGDASTQNKEPHVFFQNEIVANGVVITNKAKDKDIASLLTAIDYLYGEGAALKSFGFSEEQQAELKNEFYIEHNIDSGAYSLEKNEEGEDVYMFNPDNEAEDGLAVALSGLRLPGKTINHNVDRGYLKFVQHGYDQAKRYSTSGNIGNSIKNQFTSDQSTEAGSIETNINTYLSQAIPDFITGRTDINSDADWKAYCDEINSYGPEKYVDMVNEILGNK